MRPQVTRTVQKGQLQLDNRKYRHELLIGFNHREVIVEYDLVDDSCVWVRFVADGGLICVAHLVDKLPMVPQSRLKEARANRLKQQQARLARKLAEKQAESGFVETGLAQANASQTLLERASTDGRASAIEIDLTDI